MATQTPSRLHFTGNDEADALHAEEPMALLVGFVLDQQVPVQKAFSGPLELKRRFGTLDAAKIAEADPGELDRIFATSPRSTVTRARWPSARRISRARSHPSTAATP